MANTRLLLPSLQPDARVRFYLEGLGLAVERSWDDPGNRGWLLRSGHEAFIEILEANDNYPAGSNDGVQLVLQVADVDHVVENLRGLGARMIAEPANQPWGLRNAQVADPEGLIVNLFMPLG